MVRKHFKQKSKRVSTRTRVKIERKPKPKLVKLEPADDYPKVLNADRKIRSKYRKCYSTDAMKQALDAVDNGASVYKASRQFGIPETTIRDRVAGRVRRDCTAPGPEKFFTIEEEEAFVEHLMEMSKVGYSYTRSDALHAASDIADFLGKREYFRRKNNKQPLSHTWFQNFLKRWPCLKIYHPRSLGKAKDKEISLDAIQKYYAELESIMDKYKLKGNPHLIYNLDQSGFDTEDTGTPPATIDHVDSNASFKAFTSPPKSTTATLLACVNAIGQALPPYLIFKGNLVTADLKSGLTSGASVHVSDSPCSYSKLLVNYFETHFLKYVPRSDDKHVLLLYDGHSIHVSQPVINKAREHNIVLFVLPPHNSQVTQTLDDGCFAPIKRMYNSECQEYIAEHPDTSITEYNMCSLICNAHNKALTIPSIISSFKETGIFLLNTTEIKSEETAPSFTVNPDMSMSYPSTSETSPLAQLLPSELPRTSPVKRKRSNKSSRKTGEIQVPSPTTHIDNGNIPPMIVEVSLGTEGSPDRPAISTQEEPEPGPSHIHSASDHGESPLKDSPDNKELCCQCQNWSPPNLSQDGSLKIVSWAQCCKCYHWVHLGFCCTVTHHDPEKELFYCPCCVDVM